MEVSGRRPPKDRDKASDEDFHIFCHPCDSVGQHLPAHGYCQNCQEYLCKSCYSIHTKPTPMRQHVLLDKSNMPKPTSTRQHTVPVSLCTVACPTHAAKLIEFYCPKQATSICGVCAVLDYKACKVDYIPDISNNYQTSQEYTSLKATIDQLEKKVDSCNNSANVNIKQAVESNRRAQEEIRKFQAEMNSYLNQRVNDLLMEAQKLEKDDGESLQKVKVDCQSMQSEITQVKTSLTKVEHESSNLFVIAKQKQSHISDLQGRLDKCKGRNKASCYRFQREQAVENIMSSKVPLGKLEKIDKLQDKKTTSSQSPPKPTMDLAKAKKSRLPDIKIKTKQDKSNCWITGACLLPNNRLLLVDNNNNSIKSVDTVNNTVTSQVKLSSSPWEITLITSDQAAVTLPGNKQIQVISTRGHLSLGRVIKVNGKCRGISSTVDILAVSYSSPSKVEIMDHSGAVLQTITTVAHGQPLFKIPYYITVNTEDETTTIYVSDFVADTITKMSLQGNILSTYEDKDLYCPEALAITENRQLLVCNWGKDNVHLVSPSGEKLCILINKTDGLNNPFSICYCSDENKMYIGCYDSSNTMKVYSLQAEVIEKSLHCEFQRSFKNSVLIKQKDYKQIIFNSCSCFKPQNHTPGVSVFHCF